MLAIADKELASTLMREHLEVLWASRRFDSLRSGCIFLDEMTTILPLMAKNNFRRDYYFVKLGARYYDSGPPTVAFVRPEDWEEARLGTRWFPEIPSLPNFHIHDQYNFTDGTIGQLVCFSFSAGYYLSDHSPQESEVWKKGTHTVAATINRLSEILTKHYVGPTG